MRDEVRGAGRVAAGMDQLSCARRCVVTLVHMILLCVGLGLTTPA
jgi:hypothetical protein